MIKNISCTQELYDALGETSAQDIVLVRDESMIIYEVVKITNEEDHGITIIEVKITR